MRRSFLSGRALVVLSCWVLFGTLAILIPAILPIYLVLGACILAALLHERGYQKELETLSITLSAPSRLELCSDGVLTGEISSSSAVPQELSITLHLPEELSTPSPRVTVRDGSFSCAIRAARIGTPTISEARVFHTSPRGLWLFERAIPFQPLSLPILPPLAPMTDQAFHAFRSRYPHLHQGLRLFARNTSPDQYFSSRPYQYPDPLKYLDPRKSAKFGQPFTKMFDSLHERHVVVAIDVGRACVGTIEGSAKHDYYRAAALWIMQHAIHLGDSASLIAFADEIKLIVPKTRSLRAFDAVRTSSKLRAQDVASSYDALHSSLRQVAPQRSVVILLTDISLPTIQEELLSLLPRISQKHLCYGVGMLEDAFALELKIGAMSDAPNAQEYMDLVYSYWLDESYRNLSLSLSRSGAEAIAVPQSYWMSTCLRIYDQMRTSMAA